MSVTLQEILTQPTAWHEAVQRALEVQTPFRRIWQRSHHVLFTGCGSTYYLSLAAAALFQQLTKRPARGVPGSELLLNPETVLDGRTDLLIAVSRSGATEETLQAVKRFRALTQGKVIAITTNGHQPLAALADLALVLETAREKSVVQTRSFSAMYVATTTLATVAHNDPTLLEAVRRLPALGAQLITQVHDTAKKWGEDGRITHFYFLGSGILYGLASEASLKMKEMSLSHSEPFHFLEFRHGPMSMVDENTLLVGLLSERNQHHEQAVLDEMADLGAHVFSLGESGTTVSFKSQVPEVVRGALYLPPLQLMAYYRAALRGLDPDHPRHLSPVVKAQSLG